MTNVIAIIDPTGPHRLEETMDAGKYRRRRFSQLDRWKASGTVTELMHSAAIIYESDFDAANLGPRYAKSTIGERVDNSPPDAHQDAVIAANARIAAADASMGLIGSAVVHDVIGEGMTLRECARRHRWSGRHSDQKVVKGVLISALGALVTHYRV